MSTDIVPVRSSIGNADAPARDFARTGAISATTNHPTPSPIGAPGANTEPVPRDAVARPARAGDGRGFLTANGSRDSHAVILSDGRRNGSPRAGTPYRRISWGGILELVANPGAVEKDSAPLVILSRYVEPDGRTHDVQRSRGVYGGLAVDIDKGDPSLDQVADAVRDAVGPVAAVIYSSSSAEPGKRKWRVLLPLSTSLPGADYADTQLALFGLLEERGLVCDPTLARSAQPVYLPNVPPKRRGPDGVPIFYRSRVVRGEWLDLAAGSPLAEARAALRARREEEEAQAAVTAAANREKRLARVAATGDDFDPIEHFNQNHTVEQMLLRYGFQRSPKQRGSHWKSPLSESGSYSTEDRGDHWVTVSAWAHSHNVGRTSKTGNRYGDAFDLYVAFEHHGDRSAAVGAYAREVRPARPGQRLHELPAVRVETHAPAVEVVPIDQYRRDLQQAIGVVILDGTPGLRIFRGAPGTGKTTAVSRTVARRESGVTSVPGHELAGEVVARLREAGADAAAYPPLDESTCENFSAASRARAAGLSVPATVCPKCPLLRQCRERGYLAGVREAEKAPHKVVTHARFARSAARLTKNASYVVLEEDPTTALRPTVTATRRELERIGDLADVLADAERRWWILERAGSVADAVPEPVAEFAAWAPEEVGVTAGTTPEVSSSATPADDSDAPRRRTTRAYPAGFFGQLCRVADELADAIAGALLEESPATVRALNVRPARDIPKNPEGIIWRGVEMIERVDPDGAAGISADAMRLVLQAATGGGRLYLQVETDSRPGQAGKRTAEVVAIGRTYLPADRMPVIVNDGTLDPAVLERLAECPVEDITPSGSAPLLHHALQYPEDVLPSTSSGKVAAILAGIARKHPDRERLGVVLHQRHYRELVESEDSPLPADVRERIVWSTYFGSGADRGTNGLHAVADLAIVIGTHRPPPAEIRRTLLRWGELDAASGAGTWGRVDRTATGPDGATVAFHGRGYAEAAWARAADACTRATMRQTVARSRAICPDGVPVVAVTSEATGLPVAEPGSLPVADLRADGVILAVKKLSKIAPENGDKNPIYVLGVLSPFESPVGVTLEAVAGELSGVDYRTAKRWVARAVEAGDLVRTGNGRAVRYWLPGTVPDNLGKVPDEPVVEPVEVATPITTPARPVAAPAPLSLARVEPPRPVVVEVARPAAPPPPPAPVVVTLSPSRSPVVEPARPSVPPPRPTPRPVVVEPKAPRPDWLAEVLDPDRHRDELLAAEFFMAGPWARELGLPAAWDREISHPLVVKLHATASTEAKRRGQPPPPVEVVAGHTVAFYAATLQAVAG